MLPELPNASLVPFVVSVTGHRDLRPQDLAALRLEVKSIFDGMRSRMPSTPILLLNGLAEGADQLVAEVALAEGLMLVAVLPMPMDIYRTTMTEQAAEKLDGLYVQSSVKIELPMEGRTRELLKSSEDARAMTYEALALYLTQHGQALIALWDGKHSDKRGGTARVVHYVRSGVSPEGSGSIDTRCGIVYQVVTPRLSGGDAEHMVRTLRLGCEPFHATVQRTPEPRELDEHDPSTLSQVELNLERFNRESLRVAARVAEPKSRLIEDAGLPLSPFLQRLETLYGQADAISVNANVWRKFFLSMILISAVLGALFYGIDSEVLSDLNLWFWISFPFFVVAALVFHQLAKVKHVETQYMDARALAEAIRVQFFWAMAGIPEPVDQYYLMHERTELDWIRFALKNVWLLHQGSRDEAVGPNLQAVLDHWVRHQGRWYGAKASRQSQIVRRREQTKFWGMFGAVSWSVIVAAAILSVNRLDKPLWKAYGQKHTLIGAALHVLLAIPALAVGAYRFWIEQEGYEEQSREYRFMEREFATKAKELETHLHSKATAQQIVRSLGVEALKENGRWLLLHRERPLEVLSSP